MNYADAIQVADYTVTDEGFIVSKARFARSGIQVYRVGEPSLEGKFGDRKPGELIRVWRPEDEVFADDSMQSIAGKPLTIEHEDGFVTPKNARKVLVGMVGDSVSRDGNHVVGMVRVTHEDGIQAISGGKLELSVGYSADIEIASGTTPNGEAYDAIQRNIRANHVSLVSHGRCGGSCVLHDAGDSADRAGQTNRETSMSTKVIDCGGSQVEVSDAAAIAIKAMQDKHATEVDGLQKRISDMESEKDDMEEEDAKKDAKIDSLQTELDAANEKLTPQALDAAVKERAEVIDGAKKLSPEIKTDGLDTAAIKRAALEAIDLKLDGKSDTYVDAAFEARVEVADSGKPSAATRTAEKLGNGSKTTDKVTDSRAAYMDRTRNAHRRQGGED